MTLLKKVRQKNEQSDHQLLNKPQGGQELFGKEKEVELQNLLLLFVYTSNNAFILPITFLEET